MNTRQAIKTAEECLDEKLFSVAGRKRHQATPEEIHVVASETSLTTDIVRIAAWQDARLSPTQHLSLPVLLVRKDKDTGIVARLELDLLTAAHWQGGTGFTPSAQMCCVQLKQNFADSLTSARAALNRIAPAHPVWPDDAAWAIRWHLSGCNPAELEGGSLGGALAVGALALLRQNSMLPANSEAVVHHELLHHVAISAEIANDGTLSPVAGLSHKWIAAQRSSHQFHAMFNGGAHPVLGQKEQKKASPEPVQVATLHELLAFLRELHRQSIEAKRPRPYTQRRSWIAPSAVAAVLGFTYILSLVWPWTGALRYHLPEAVRVNKVHAPLGCDHIVHVGTIVSDLSVKDWSKGIVPTLKWCRRPVALVIGSSDYLQRQPETLAFEDFDELRCLRSLALLHSGLTKADGLRKLRGLKKFAVIGSRITNLGDIGNAKELDTLILDSGFIGEYPNLNFPQLESLILHWPGEWETLDLSGCPNLRRLAVCGNGLIQIVGLSNLKHLEELIIYGEALDPGLFDLHLLSHITHLELAGLKNLGSMNIAADLPQLRTLVLKGTSVERLEGFAGCKQLESVSIENAQALDAIDLRGASSLRSLDVRNSLLIRIENLSDAVQLQSLSLNRTCVGELQGMSGLKSLEKLAISDAPLLESLHLEGVASLKYLAVKGASLVNVSGLGDARLMTSLEITECPLAALHGIDRLFSLKSANLAETQIAELPALTALPSLEFLNVRGTKLKALPALGSKKECKAFASNTPFAESQPDQRTWVWNSKGLRSTSADYEGSGGDSLSVGEGMDLGGYDYGYYHDTFRPNYSTDYIEVAGKRVALDQNGWKFDEASQRRVVFDAIDILGRWKLLDIIGVEGGDYWEDYPIDTYSVSPIYDSYDTDAKPRVSSFSKPRLKEDNPSPNGAANEKRPSVTPAPPTAPLPAPQKDER